MALRTLTYQEGIGMMATPKRVSSGGFVLTCFLTEFDVGTQTWNGFSVLSTSQDAGHKVPEFRPVRGARRYDPNAPRRVDNSEMDFQFVDLGEDETGIRAIATENARGHLNAPARPNPVAEVKEDDLATRLEGDVDGDGDIDRDDRRLQKKIDKTEKQK